MMYNALLQEINSYNMEETNKQFDLEQYVLGGLLVRNSTIIDCDLTESDFCHSSHAKLFTKITHLIATDKQCNISDLVNWANENIPLDDGGLGGYDYVRLLAECAIGTSDSVKNCSEQIKEIGRKAKIKSALMDALEGIETKGSGETLSALSKTLKEETDTSQILSVDQVRKNILESMEKPKECYPTGITPLDEVMAGGMYAGYTYGLCGAEKAGKTTMAHTISYNIKENHLYIAMEMGSMQIEQRNLARDLQINSLQFLKDGSDLKNKVECAKPNKGTFYLDCPGADVDEIIRHIGNAILKHDIKGVIVDYWQLIMGQQRGENEEKHLRYSAQTLANFARKQGIWCLLLAQMNKDGGLFGGNGLRKACDQLYMIERCKNSEYGRWLRMDASRYTYKADVGSETEPMIMMNAKVGPYFEEGYI